MNPLFQMMNKPNGNMMQLLQQFQQFKQNFKGNPQEMVQQLLNSGRIVTGKDEDAVFAVFDELLSTLQGMIPRLYAGVIGKLQDID